MIASGLLNTNIPALQPKHTLLQGLEWMSEYHLQHIAVVNHAGKLVGILTEEVLLNTDSLDDTIGNLKWDFEPVSIHPNEHIFDIIPVMQQHKLSAIAVVDNDKNYLGLVTQEAILNCLANQYSMNADGGLLLLNMKAPQYSMAEISQIVEANGGRILCSYVDYKRDNDEVDVLLKVNLQDVDYLIATFERYDYVVKATYQNPSDNSKDVQLQENYDALMNYLNI